MHYARFIMNNFVLLQQFYDMNVKWQIWKERILGASLV